MHAITGWLTSTARNTVAAAAFIVATGALTLLGTRPASAAIDGNCQGVVCIAIDHNDSFVNDATVSVTDGGAAHLHIFIGNRTDVWSPGYQSSFRTAVGWAFDGGTLVCGEAWSVDSHLLGRTCYRL
jgi:hypothetical protein